MPLSNLERMIQLADEVFAVKNDPSQLDVNEKVIKQLQSLHPATISEHDDGKGPVAWILVIPTTSFLMKDFLSKKITERELVDLTPLHDTKYDALYLCSALVLTEYRGKGIAKRLALEAIASIRKQHPLQTLFVWPFSKEGDALADTIAHLVGLPLLKRETEK